MAEFEVVHNQDKHCFTAQLNGAEAIMEYELLLEANKQGVNFYHTFVPPACRGKGVAESLVRAGLAWAKAQNYDIKASCWYVQKFIR